MSTNYGLLYSLVEPGPVDDQEFNEWYDLDHIPERMRLPGFLAAQRYRAIEGWPQYLTIYDISGIDMLYTPEYAAVGGTNITPWTKRIMLRVRGWTRGTGTQIHPGNAKFHDSGKALRFIFLEFMRPDDATEAQILKGMKSLLGGRSDILQYRVFRSEAGAECTVLVEACAPLQLSELNWEAIGELRKSLRIANLYVPTEDRYWPTR